MTDILSVRGINKNFGSKQVLHDVSFKVKEGRIAGLVGPNGAGKTTIMKIILGLINFQSGKIEIDGQPVSTTSHQVLSEVGALIEYPGIYPFLSGWDHLKLFSAQGNSNEKIKKIVDELKMGSYIHQKARGYSLGMKQKLGIALAFVNNPKLVILDEPMNGLDPQATKDLRDLILNEARSGKTFLISSHILSELQKLADDLIVIDHGTIVQETTMDKLLSQGASYIRLTTSDDQQAKNLLANAGFKLMDDAKVKVIVDGENIMPRILKVMSDNSLDVQDVEHNKGNLENSLLDILAHDEEKEK